MKGVHYFEHLIKIDIECTPLLFTRVAHFLKRAVTGILDF